MRWTKALYSAWLGIFLAMTMVSAASASELRYTPVNPNFGGSSFNGSVLMSEAQAENDNREPVTASDPLQNFSRAITSALLGRISQQISDAILGENAQNSGTFTIGSTVLDFNRVDDIVTINITDTASGQQTTVEVPAPVF